MIKQTTYNLLILFILVSFSFFGSLSHIFSLALIMLIFFNDRATKQKNDIEFNAKIVFVALSGCFFLFLFTSIFRSNFGPLLHSLSPMLPLPFIGMLMVFHGRANFKLSSKEVSQFSQISVFFSYFTYLILSSFFDRSTLNFDLYGRIMLFSGNPIPFSFTILGLSILSLSNWNNSKLAEKFQAITCFALGIYIGSFLSGTRSTLLAVVLISPILIFYLSKNWQQGLTLTFLIIISSIALIKLNINEDLQNNYLRRIKDGFETLVFFNDKDSSIAKRIQMWSASISAIYDNPLFGNSITERFNAIVPYLPKSFPIKPTHPHNDILASIISSGFFGGIAALASLMATFIAALLSSTKSSEKLYLGLMLSCTTLIFANINTVFFNDITSAWLAFSTYLIWTTQFK